MDAVTDPDERVVTYMNEHVVSVKANIFTKPLTGLFNMQRGPTLVLVDPKDKEHHRTVGGLSPEDLIAPLFHGIGQTHTDRGECSSARTALQRVMSDYLDSDAAPEALYLSGVVRCKQSDDIHEMNETLTQLREKHPTREWINRASVHESD